MPHRGIDPVRVAFQIVSAFQTIISRNKRPIDAGVISVTMIHTGEAINVVPDSCEMRGTVRTFTLEVLDLIEARMKQVAEHTGVAHAAVRVAREAGGRRWLKLPAITKLRATLVSGPLWHTRTRSLVVNVR